MWCVFSPFSLSYDRIAGLHYSVSAKLYPIFIIFRSVVCYLSLTRLLISQNVHIHKPAAALQSKCIRTKWLLMSKKCMLLGAGCKYFPGRGSEWAPWWSECKDVLAACHSLSLLSRVSASVSVPLFAAGCNNSSTCLVVGVQHKMHN